MAIRYNKEIKQLELQGRLKAQENSRFTIEAEILKLTGRIEDMKDTLLSLDKAIAESKQLIAEK